MKILLCLLLCILLGGCGGHGYRDRREIESFEIVQTVGIDYEKGMYTVTAATGADSGGQVSVLTSEAVTLARAMKQMQDYSSKRYVFFGHSANCLVGESAAENDLSECLEYVERGLDMRLDTNLFVVCGGTAEDAIAGAVESGGSVNEHLLALEKDVQILSENHIFDCGDVAESIAESGEALVTAVSLWDNENVPVGEGSKGLQVVGYAVIDGGRLAAYADVDTSRGITLLLDRFVTDSAELPDGQGRYAAVELTGGRAEYSARFEHGELKCIRIDLKLRGSLAETESPIDIYDERTVSELERVLAEAELKRAVNVLELSRRLGVDIIGLEKELDMKYPVKLRRAREAGLPACIADVEAEVYVRVDINRTYELGISPAERRRLEREGG